MFLTKIKIATTILVMTLACNGLCLTAYSSMQACQSAPIQPTPPSNNDANVHENDAANHDATQNAKKANKMFPDGLDYDFGKVTRGTQCKHSFRIVNTTNVPLRIISLRWA
jgi:hypothetical protein